MGSDRTLIVGIPQVLHGVGGHTDTSYMSFCKPEVYENYSGHPQKRFVSCPAGDQTDGQPGVLAGNLFVIYVKYIFYIHIEMIGETLVGGGADKS